MSSEEFKEENEMYNFTCSNKLAILNFIVKKIVPNPFLFGLAQFFGCPSLVVRLVIRPVFTLDV